MRMVYRIGQGFMLLMTALTVFSILYFASVSLERADLADYIRNHFVREILWGLTLSGVVASLTLQARSAALAALFGGLLVAPFWLGYLGGIGKSEIGAVWGDTAAPTDSLMLHATQVVLFGLGAFLMSIGAPKAVR